MENVETKPNAEEAETQYELKSKNWKSTLAFILFLIIYAYSVYDNRDSSVIDVTGYIALISMAFMMLRDRKLGELIDKIISTKFQKNS